MQPERRSVAVGEGDPAVAYTVRRAGELDRGAELLAFASDPHFVRRDVDAVTRDEHADGTGAGHEVAAHRRAVDGLVGAGLGLVLQRDAGAEALDPVVGDVSPSSDPVSDAHAVTGIAVAPSDDLVVADGQDPQEQARARHGRRALAG